MKRKTRVIYVENDVALLSLVSERLRDSPVLDLIFEGQGFVSTLEFAQKNAFDVALIEMVLGNDPQAGLELAFALRELNPNCGLVVFSALASKKLVSSLPIEQKMGFSFIQKSNPVDFDWIETTLVSTSQGYSSIDEALVEESELDDPLFAEMRVKLSVRDHQIMRMLVDGKNTECISRTLFLSQVTVRQEMSRIYTVLVPNRTVDGHVRTQAMNEYSRILGGGFQNL